MPKRIDNVVLATGTLLSRTYGVPTVRDMALGLGKECRYAGNVRQFWPVLLHTFVVCDLLPNRLKPYAHFHDGIEVGGGDKPKPFKTHHDEQLEQFMESRMWAAYGIKPLRGADYREFKQADRACVVGEVWTIGPPGLAELRYPVRKPHVEKLILYYAKKYPGADCIKTGGGRAAAEFERRFREYLKYR